MKICMLEPLAVDGGLIEELAAPLRKMGHECIPCSEKLDAKTASKLDADVFIIANSPLSGEGLIMWILRPVKKRESV